MFRNRNTCQGIRARIGVCPGRHGYPLVLLFLGILFSPAAARAEHEVRLVVESGRIVLGSGPQSWQFGKTDDRWALEGIAASGTLAAKPVSLADSFFVGGGFASGFKVLTNTTDCKAIAFQIGTNRATYWVDRNEPLSLIHARIDGPEQPVCAFRAAMEDSAAHGAWVTRGWVATDADASEAFIDASNPMVFGHSHLGGMDVCYVFLPAVRNHIQKNGRTEQRTDTWFKSQRQETTAGLFSGRWQLRMGVGEPKEFGVLFDRDLGGRLSDVCEKYYAPAVDTLVTMPEAPAGYDPNRCMEVLPVRLASPDAFIPGYGWMMDEYPNASYPFAHDSVWQQSAMLAYEGLATDRAWEKNFARYILEKTPLEGPDGTSYFVRRPGGLTRWAYWSTYKEKFPHFEGGTWWQADILYKTALALNDAPLRRAAVDMARHDLDVKLDLKTMRYPPCWNAIKNRAGDDHRDDWFQTPGLAYCAYMAAKVVASETGDPSYLDKADRICAWFAGFMTPETKLNFIQGNNMHAVFSHYLTLAFLEKFERSGDTQFLDLARDMAWVHIMTSCTTSALDSGGHPMLGVTCVGVRECVDYDCAPNLCHEKDLCFVHIIGPLLDHVKGPAYAKYIALQRMILDKDSWKSGWAADLRETNLRTLYDTYARGMANLIYALNPSGNPGINVVDQLVSKNDPAITHRRDLVLSNGTLQERDARLQIRFLRSGRYALTIDGVSQGEKTHSALAAGIPIHMPPNSMKGVRVRSVALDPETPAPARQYDDSTTWLSDLAPFAAQRGTGAPQPVFVKDRSFGGGRIQFGDTAFDKGLGCAANSVLIYDLQGTFQEFKARVGVAREVAGANNPSASVFFTVHVDGLLRFESGPMFANTPAKNLSVDVRNARMVMLRVSCNWDNNGDATNDHGDWADARLVGRAIP